MAGHTPGKLQLSPDGIGIPLIDDSEQVVTLVPVSVKRTPQAEWANATRLALCWNTHDELVAALEEVIGEHERWLAADERGDLVLPSVDAARAALAAARGEA